ncbi:MAG: glycosyltransferase [Bacteriovoracaceae bacterium]|nr:glycosyltransferase [Bacteriovoracaceae bacterium]
MNERFSIIIPVLRFEPILKQVVLSIKAQIYPAENVEIIIVQNSSQETEVPQFFKQHARVIQINKASRPLARNTGAQHAKFSTLLFLDENSLLTKKNILLKLSRYKELSVVQLQIRPSTITEKESSLQTYTRTQYYKATKYSWNVALNGTCLDTAGLIVPKQTLLELDGFDLNYNRFEDREFALRLTNKGVQIEAPLDILINKVIEDMSFKDLLNREITDFYYQLKYRWKENKLETLKQFLIQLLLVFSPLKLVAIVQKKTSASTMLISTITSAIQVVLFTPMILLLSCVTDTNDSEDWVAKEVIS